MTKIVHVDTAEQAFAQLRLMDKPQRQCGECTLCCKLLPVVELGKGANTSCQFQKFKKGCAVYHTTIPHSCQMWNCRWLVNDDTADQSRPDRSGYVIDIMPDYITATDNETGENFQVEVVQIWTTNRTIHRTDKNLRAYIDRRGKEGKLCLLRFNSKDALTIFPPSMTSDGQWHELVGQSGPQHTPGQVFGLEER